MALEGTLKDFSLADIFQLIGIQRKTGVLTLRNGKEVATISFINGMVVGADTDNQKLENRLGHVLVKTNRISQGELEQALAIQNSTLQRLGQVLISKGFIKKEDLKDSLQMQVSEIIYRLFRWIDGDYHFRQERFIDYDQENFSPISAESLLMEGIRMIDEWPMIERVIPNFDVTVERSERGRRIKLNIDKDISFQSGPVGSFDDLLENVMADETESPVAEPLPSLSHEQEVVMKLIEGPITVQKVIDKSRLNEFETCRAVFDLIEHQLVRKVSDVVIEREIEEVEEQRTVPLWVPLAVGALLSLLGVLTHWNPINRFFPSVNSLDQSSAFFAAESRHRMVRIARALDLFFLDEGKLPYTLDVLVDRGLLEKDGLSDPKDQGYQYILRPDEQTYTLKGYDKDGGSGNRDLILTWQYTRPIQEDVIENAETDAQ